MTVGLHADLDDFRTEVGKQHAAVRPSEHVTDLEDANAFERPVGMRAGVRADGVTAARPIEIVRFYVRGRWHGRGAAARLMKSACTFGAAHGHDALWLQVWEHNARARRFYEKSGLRAVGTKPFLFDEVWEDDIVYSRALAERGGG